MKIVFVAPVLGYMGASKMLAWVSNNVSRMGHDVTMLTFFSDKTGMVLDEKIKFDCLNIKQSKNRIVRNTVGMFKTLIKLDGYVKKEKPDVLVSFLDSVGYMYLPFGNRRCKIVISERIDPYSRSGILEKIKIWLMKFADVSVFQTDGARNYFKGKYDIYEKGVVIPNPVVLSDAAAGLKAQIPVFEERDNRIVTVGRLSLVQKRQDILLRAFDILHDKHPEFKLVIYGDGEDKEKIQNMINRMNLGESVVLAGKVSGVEKEILKAKAFVLTSDFEGIPNALIEALGVGVPCVSTDCSPGGAALLIKDGENGYLVPRGDVNAIVEKLEKITENKEISERFSENGQKILEAFSEEKIADMWSKVFEEKGEHK